MENWRQIDKTIQKWAKVITRLCGEGGGGAANGSSFSDKNCRMEAVKWREILRCFFNLWALKKIAESARSCEEMREHKATTDRKSCLKKAKTNEKVQQGSNQVPATRGVEHSKRRQVHKWAQAQANTRKC